MKLRILIEAVHMGSLRKAAQTFGYTAPALTSMMDSLEEEFGFPVIQRDRNGVKFTELGQMLEPYMIDFLNAENAIYNQALEFSKTQIIHIGAIPSVAGVLLPTVINEFNLKYPGIKVKLYLGTAMQKQFIKEKKVDFSLIDLMHANGLDSQVLFEDTFSAAIPIKDYPGKKKLPLDELIKHRILLPSSDEDSTPLKMLKGRPLDNVMEVVNADAIALMSMVEQGLGYGFVSSLFTEHCPRGVKLVETEPVISRQICVCANSLNDLNPAAKAFITELKSYMNLRAEYK